MKADALVLLGGGRLVCEKERAKTDIYAPGAITETDLNDGAVQSVLCGSLKNYEPYVARDRAPVQGSHTKPDYWEVHLFETTGGLPIFSAHPPFAPNSNGKNRPYSGDTYAFMRRLAEADGTLGPEAKLLMVTTGFYTLAQRLDAIREITLPTGAEIDMIGHDAAFSGVTRTAKQLKQELKAAVDAAVRLHTAITKDI